MKERHAKAMNSYRTIWPRFSTFAAVFINSQAFAVSANSPIGIRYFQEMFYVYLFAFSILYVLFQILIKKSVPKLDLTICLIVGAVIFYSSIAAHLTFGQPLFFGIIEERRVLALLIYFPLVWALRNHYVSVDQVLSWVVFSAVVCATIALASYSEIFSNAADLDAAEISLRRDRYAVGLPYIAVGILISLNSFRKHSIGKGLIILFLLIVLVVVGQTRQILIGLLASIFFLRGVRSKVSAIALILIPALILFGQDWAVLGVVQKYGQLFGEILSTNYYLASARAQTISIIISDVLGGSWFGKGALSLLWNGGFQRIYSSSFFLADVGVFGSLYKFGLWFLVIWGAYFLIQIRLLTAIKSHQKYFLFVSIFIFLIVLSPVAAIVEYRGFLAGLLLALTVSVNREFHGRVEGQATRNA